MNDKNLQQLADRNREYYEIVTTIADWRQEATDQTTVNLKMPDLDSFIAGRAREANALADALENGSLLIAADRQKARERLAQINDEMARAHQAKRKSQRNHR